MKYLGTKQFISSQFFCFLCIVASITQKLTQVIPTCNLKSNASYCTESLIIAILCVLFTAIEDAQIVMVRESEKQ